MKEHVLKCSVRWADGTYDSKRTCDECGKENCKYPVYKDYYPEMMSRVAWEKMQAAQDHPGFLSKEILNED